MASARAGLLQRCRKGLTKMPSLSIVVTTYNRKDLVAQLIAELEQQSDPDFQLIVAIDGSTDGTADMLAGSRTPFDLKWIDTECRGYGLAVARNRGILAADGEAVVILDDDSFPDPDFVTEHKACVTAGVMTGGPRHPSDPRETRMVWKMQELAKLPSCTPLDFETLHRDWPNAYMIENNLCMRRQDWISAGLFSERLKMYGFIGQEFFARARHLNLRYQFNPRAAVCHRGEYEGNNGLQRKDKTFQTRLASILRPALMKPKHYRAQIAWSRALADDAPPPGMPAYWPDVATSIMARGARRVGRTIAGR